MGFGGPILQADFQEHKYSNFLAPIWRHIWRCTLQPVCSRLFWILSLKQKKGKKKERMRGPLGLCQQRLWVSAEWLQSPARRPWGWREEVDERDRRWEGPSAAIGEAVAGGGWGEWGERETCTKNNRNTGGNGLVGNQPVNKQSWRLETAASPAQLLGKEIVL